MKHISTELCAQLESELPAYLDGEAKESVCRALAEHLRSCEDCQIVVDTLQKTITLYRQAPRAQVPAETHARLIQVLKLDALTSTPERGDPENVQHVQKSSDAS